MNGEDLDLEASAHGCKGVGDVPLRPERGSLGV